MDRELICYTSLVFLEMTFEKNITFLSPTDCRHIQQVFTVPTMKDISHICKGVVVETLTWNAKGNLIVTSFYNHKMFR